VNPFSSRASARELAAQLEGTAQRPPSPETARAALLVDHLVRAGGELAAASAPRPEFRDALRTRLLAVAAVQPPAVPSPAVPSSEAAPEPVAAPAPPARRRRARRGPLLAGGVAAVLAVSGAGVATSRSLPGDPLYGAKRTSERLQLRLAGDPADQGLRHLQLATKRLREVEALTYGRGHVALGPAAAGTVAAGAPVQPALGALADMDAEVRTGSSLLVEQWRRDGRDAAMVAVQGWSQTQWDELTALVPALPAPAGERAQSSLDLLLQVRDEVTGLIR